MKAYIILGNNKDTQGLIEHLRKRENGTITIVDEELENGLSRRGDLTYVNGTYVDSVKDMNLPFRVLSLHTTDASKGWTEMETEFK